MKSTAHFHTHDPHHYKLLSLLLIPELAYFTQLSTNTKTTRPVTVFVFMKHKVIQEGSREFTLT